MAWTEAARKAAAAKRKAKGKTSRVTQLKAAAKSSFNDLSKGGHFSQAGRNVLARNAKFFSKTLKVSLSSGYAHAIDNNNKNKKSSVQESSVAKMARENLALTYRNPRRPR